MPDVTKIWRHTEFKIRYSDTFHPFGYSTVTIFARKKGTWELVLPDMAPCILERCKLPTPIIQASKMVVEDRKTRRIKLDGTITILHELITPPTPKLAIPPERPKLLIIEEED